jgi:hypothetical protein
MNNKPSDKAIKRFITMLAFFNEAHPSPNPKVNAYWREIKKKHDHECLKYGKCEVCGEEDLLGEYGLNWVCDNPDCLEVMKNYYDNLFGV